MGGAYAAGEPGISWRQLCSLNPKGSNVDVSGLQRVVHITVGAWGVRGGRAGHLLPDVAARRHSAKHLPGSNRYFQVLGLYWQALESGSFGYKSRRLKRTI